MADTSIGNGGVRHRARTGGGLYAHVVDVIGQDIINGQLPPGSIVYADQLCERLGVSRSVVREGVRTLSSMGLVEARPQVGTRVLPQSQWDLLNPSVVRWRWQGPVWAEQMRELLELRLGVEHAAAGLAAFRIPRENAEQILAHALEMRDALIADEPRRFFDADMMFHRLILEGTGNAVMAQLADTVGATLDARGHDTRPGMHDMTAGSVDNHIALAQALIDRDADAAQRMALRLVELTIEEFDRVQATVRPDVRAAAQT